MHRHEPRPLPLVPDTLARAGGTHQVVFVPGLGVKGEGGCGVVREDGEGGVGEVGGEGGNPAVGGFSGRESGVGGGGEEGTDGLGLWP